jgi:hypothetical protein
MAEPKKFKPNKLQKPKSDTAPAAYEPTPREQAALGEFRSRRLAENTPRLKVSNDGNVPDISVDHQSQTVGNVLLAQALGTTDEDFIDGLLLQLANVDARDGQVNERGLNFLLSVIKGIKPKDQLEAMLAAQMAVAHMASMRFARQLQRVETLPQQDSAERAFNKLARTYTTQLEALKRYRTGGEQKVTVQHVSVNEGGQAIVGNVTQNATAKAPAKSAPALTDAQKPPMTTIDEPKRARATLRRWQDDDEKSST